MKRTRTQLIPQGNQAETIEQNLAKLSSLWIKISDNKWALNGISRDSSRIFLKNLKKRQVFDAMIRASKKYPENTEEDAIQRFKYFCRICWEQISRRKSPIIKIIERSN